MSTEALNYHIQIQENFDNVFSSFNNFQNHFNQGINSIQDSLNGIKLQALISNIDAAASGLEALSSPGLKLNSNMHDLQAITGIAGEKLKEIEGYARENAKTFGGSAADGAESYKTILSKLSPEIAKVPKALKEMGTQVSLTSKLMGGDTAGATELLTTAMNQYEVSLQDPIKAAAEMAKMNNIMAKSAQEGSAEFPEINAALQAGGLTAKKANIDFAETNAWFQVLDKSGKKGAEGGTAFRNVIATLNQGRFLPKDVKKELESAGVDINALTDKSKSFADRLKPLKLIMNDSALMTKFFGKENQAAGIAMISGIAEAERLTEAVKGTNSVQEQASIVMESQAEKNARLKAEIDDYKISLFNATDGLIGYASEIGNVARDVGNLMPIMSGMGTVIKTVTSASKMQALWTSIVAGATSVWTAVQGAFNTVMMMNPVVLIVAGIIALIAAIAWVVSSTEGWGNAWKHTVNGAKLIFMAYVQLAQANFNTLVNGIMIGINKIQIGWYKFKNAVGMGDESSNTAMINQLNSDVEKRKESIKEGYKQAAETALKAKDEFAKAVDSVKWKKDKKELEDNGIKPPEVPGTTDDETIIDTNDEDSKGSGKKTNQATATGGTKHNYITISIQELTGIKTGTVTGGKDAANKAGNEVADELLRVLAMASSTTG